MDAALKTMNLEKVFLLNECLCIVSLCLEGFMSFYIIIQVAGIMDQFERQFEHLDVQTQTMEEAMSGVTTLTIPEVSLFSFSI